MNTELVVAVVIIIIYNVIFNRKVLRFEMIYFGEYAEHLKADERKSDTPYWTLHDTERCTSLIRRTGGRRKTRSS